MSRPGPMGLGEGEAPSAEVDATQVPGRERSVALGRAEVAPEGRPVLATVDPGNRDVVTLDVDMPRTEGLATARRTMTTSPRSVIVSATHGGAGAGRAAPAPQIIPGHVLAMLRDERRAVKGDR